MEKKRLKIKFYEATFILVANGKPYKVEYRYNQQDDLYELYINDKLFKMTGICTFFSAKRQLSMWIEKENETASS